MNKSWTFESRAGSLVLDARKAAFLPVSKTLLVADLHFEKGSYLQMAGNSALPGYDTAETVDRFGQVIEAYKPRHVVALGDSFHDEQAGERLSALDAQALNAVVAMCPQFTWILGNHDPLIPNGIDGDVEDHLDVDDLFLTHLPTDGDTGQVNICGHLHPKMGITIRRRRMTYPCFACSDTRIILPSFGAYTGGLSVKHNAIMSVMGENKTFVLTTPTGIYPISDDPKER